jgi:hemolysin activation/secretion protein
MRRVCTGLLVTAPLLMVQAAPTGIDPILQQALPAAPAPSPSRSTVLSVEDEMDAHAPPPSSSVMVEVKVIKILGNTLFDTATLQALVGDAVGKRLNLAQLDELAARIRNHYRSQGHKLVRVVTPAQRFYAGIVRILVIEAPQSRTGNDKRPRLNDLLLQDLSYDLPPEATASPGDKGETSPPLSSSVLIDVKALKILGNTLFDTATLHPLIADAEGKRQSYDQLDELAVRIRNYYHGRGYRQARVVTPAQIIREGVVRILVIEAPYGRVGIDSQVRLNDLLLQGLAASAAVRPRADDKASLKPAPESETSTMGVKALRIMGNTTFDEATLHALVADGEGKDLSLAQLDGLAARISDYYRSKGYPYARAVVPAQVIQSGVVHLLVIEARYDKVEINNQTRVDDQLVQATLSPIKTGQPVDQPELDEALLLLSDTPGVVVNATLKPGRSAGTADLLVEASPGPAYSGNLTLDDYGNSYTGRARLGANLYVNNPLRHGDVLSLGGLSAGSGLNYGRVGYDALLTGRGTRAGAAYSSMNYGLGGSLTNLDARGSSETGSTWLRQPLLRSQDANLYGQIQYDAVQLRERIGAAAIQTDRRVNSWTWSLTGDSRDSLLSEGINTWSLGWTKGRVAYDDASAQSVDAATAKTEGEFSKWNLSLSRLQGLGRDKALYLAFSGQWAGNNLDSSQKISIGGPYSVRAYEIGALSGDAGYRGTLEFRYDLGPLWQGRFETVVFLDSANVTVNQSPWTTGPNSATLSGAGIGFNWTGQSQWRVRTYIATPIGPKPELVRNPDTTRAGSEIGFQF